MRSKIARVVMLLGLMTFAACSNGPSLLKRDLLQSLSGEVTLANDKYRLGGAGAAELASFGRLLRRGSNRYQKDGLLGWEQMPVRVRNVVTINWTDRKNFGGEFEKTLVRVQGESTNLQEEGYRVVIIEMRDPLELEKRLREKSSSDPLILEKMKNPDFRFITASALVFDHKFSKDLSISASVGATISGWISRPIMKFSAEIGGKQEITLGDNNIVAYQYRRLCWRDDEFVDSIRDQAGPDRDCPDGTSWKYTGAAP